MSHIMKFDEYSYIGELRGNEFDEDHSFGYFDDYYDDSEHEAPYKWSPGEHAFEYEMDLWDWFMSRPSVTNKIAKNENLIIDFNNYLDKFVQKNRITGWSHVKPNAYSFPDYYKFDLQKHKESNGYRSYIKITRHNPEYNDENIIKVREVRCNFRIIGYSTIDKDGNIIYFELNKDEVAKAIKTYTKLVNECDLLNPSDKNKMIGDFKNKFDEISDIIRAKGDELNDFYNDMCYWIE